MVPFLGYKNGDFHELSFTKLTVLNDSILSMVVHINLYLMKLILKTFYIKIFKTFIGFCLLVQSKGLGCVVLAPFHNFCMLVHSKSLGGVALAPFHNFSC